MSTTTQKPQNNQAHDKEPQHEEHQQIASPAALSESEEHNESAGHQEPREVSLSSQSPPESALENEQSPTQTQESETLAHQEIPTPVETAQKHSDAQQSHFQDESTQMTPPTSTPRPDLPAISTARNTEHQYSSRNTFAALPKMYFGNNVSLWENENRDGLVSSSYTSRALEHLKRKSLQEGWGSNAASTTSADFVLKTYLDLTFRRVHHLGSILAYWEEKSIAATSSRSTSSSQFQSSARSGRSKPSKKKRPTSQQYKPIILIWDTGLIAKSMQPLYCIMIPFNKPPRHESSNQFNARWCIRYFQVPSKFASHEKKEHYYRLLGQEFCDAHPSVEGIKRSLLPKPATYFSDVLDVQSVLFDPKVHVRRSQIATDYGKSVLARSCLPRKLQTASWHDIEQRMKLGLEESLVLVQRDHRTAIPVCVPPMESITKHNNVLSKETHAREFYFYDAFDSGGPLEAQLLVPVCTLRRTYSPDCAAMLRFVSGNGGGRHRSGIGTTSQGVIQKPYYEVTRLMRIEEAYILARRCQHVDQSWLIRNPMPIPPNNAVGSHVMPTSTALAYSSPYPSSSGASTPTPMTPTGTMTTFAYAGSPQYVAYATPAGAPMLMYTTPSMENLPPNYKTTLCSSFKLYGWCPYGAMCHFAHGLHELRGNPEVFEQFEEMSSTSGGSELAFEYRSFTSE